MEIRIFNLVLLFAVLTSSRLFAADLTFAPPPRPATPQIAPRAVSPAMPTQSRITVFNYADVNPSCTAGMMVAADAIAEQSGDGSQISCSNIRSACQPLDEIRCSRRMILSWLPV